MIAEAVTFPCNDFTFEGEINIPQGETPFPGVVICHPHPLYGGNMLNNVVSAIFQALVSQSITAFRFNFRRAGKNQDRRGDGNDERNDVGTALDYLLARPEIDGNRIGLVGYSFGATIALAVAAKDKRVTQLVLVSPPLSEADREQLMDYQNPKITLVGDADHIISPEQIRQLSQDRTELEQYQIIPEADHFWRGHEAVIAQITTRFFRQNFIQS